MLSHNGGLSMQTDVLLLYTQYILFWTVQYISSTLPTGYLHYFYTSETFG